MDNEVVVEIIKAVAMVAVAIFGAGGLVVRWLDKRIRNEKNEAFIKEAQRKQRYVAECGMRRAQGRWMFWMTKGIERFKKDTGKDYWNGEVETAHQKYMEAEDECKRIDQEQLADHINEQ